MTTTLVGTLELASKYRYGLTSRGASLYLFVPYDESWPPHVVGSTERDTTRNQIAIVDVPGLMPPAVSMNKPRGNLIRLLGHVGDPIAEQVGLLHHYCPEKQTRIFTEEDTTHDADRMEITEATGWTVFHVDPAGCRDIDDAIAFHTDGSLAITIADAASVVPTDSIVDDTARAIGSTFYDLEGRVVRPMLPPTISEEAASLLPGSRRRGVSLIQDPAGSQRWALSWITVNQSFTYDNFATSAVAAALHISPTADIHEWIADRMIQYNAAAAVKLFAAGAGLLRVQGPADAAAVASWTTIDPALGRLGSEAATYEVVDSTKNQAHASLNLGVYCHASSPLRRYADLVNQRILKGRITGQTYEPTSEATATHLNSRTKANRRWTRDLTFLHHVTPGRVHEIDVIWVSTDRVWVPAWSRLLRLRHVEERPPGARGSIQIFCDPTRRNWKRRVLTAPVVEI
jgi:exoribonuclease R